MNEIQIYQQLTKFTFTMNGIQIYTVNENLNLSTMKDVGDNTIHIYRNTHITIHIICTALLLHNNSTLSDKTQNSKMVDSCCGPR